MPSENTPPAPQSRLSPSLQMALAVCAAVLIGQLAAFDTARQVWTQGAYFDSDDAMRMSQVRDWLGGQGWFDLSARRVDPEVGLFMHWSRIVDLPLAALMKFFGLFLAPPAAEAATRLTFPVLLLFALYGATIWTASQIGGRVYQFAALGLVLLTAPHQAQFSPGRIDHHSAQIVLLMLTAGAIFAACDPGRARWMWLAGAAIAASLAISLENMPFFAILLAAPALLQVWDGDRGRAACGALGLALLAFLPAFYVLTIGPARWSDASCDALSLGYLAAGLTGAVGYLAIWALSPHLRGRAARLALAAAAGAAALAALKLAAPACGLDPFVGLDPVLKKLWLSQVSEVEPLWRFLQTKPLSALSWAAPLSASAVVAIVFAVRAQGLLRRRLILLAAVLVLGIASANWGVRVFNSIAPLAALGAALFVEWAALNVRSRTLTPRVAAILAAAPFSPLLWSAGTGAVAAIAPAPSGAAQRQTAMARDAECFRPAQLRALDKAPPGLVLAPVDIGPALLLETRHSVLGAPYHRNNHGMRASFDFLNADARDAYAIARASHADYILACPWSSYFLDPAVGRPDAIVNAFTKGPAPDWVEKTDIEGLAPNVLYRVKK